MGEKSKRIRRIDKLPKDGLIYKLIWHGETIHYDNRKESEPSITVVFAPLSKSNLHEINSDYLNSSKSILPKRAPISISVGYLRDLSIGSLWLNRECIELPEYETITCEVDYQYENFSLFHPYERDSGGNAIMQYGGYPISYSRAAKCVGIQNVRINKGYIRRDPYGVIIPATEIIRFYYCLTSELAQAFFSGWLNDEKYISNVYNPNKTDLYAEPPAIRLGKRMPYGINSGKLVGEFLANILVSNIGLRHAEQIHQTLTASNGANTAWTYPPFLGKSNLKLIGKWLPGPNAWRFLCYRIVSCDLATPLQDQIVEWSSDIDNQRVENKADDLKPAFPTSPIVEGDNLTSDDIELETDEEPSNLKRKLRLKSPSLGWSSLIDTETIKSEKELQEYTSEGRDTMYLGDDTSVGSSGSGLSEVDLSTPVSIDACENSRKEGTPPILPEPANFSLFILAIKELLLKLLDAKTKQKSDSHNVIEKIEHTKCQIICKTTPKLPPEDAPRSLFPASWEKERLHWSFLDSLYTLPRQYIVAHIFFKDFNFYIFEAQSPQEEKTSYFMGFLASGEEFTSQTITSIATQCAYNQGGWLKNNQKQDILRVRFYHIKGDTPDKLSERFFKKIKSILIELI